MEEVMLRSELLTVVVVVVWIGVGVRVRVEGRRRGRLVMVVGRRRRRRRRDLSGGDVIILFLRRRGVLSVAVGIIVRQDLIGLRGGRGYDFGVLVLLAAEGVAHSV